MDLPDAVGEHHDQWENPKSKTIGTMRQYVGDIVGRYKDSPAIWAWEFGNEPNLSVDLAAIWVFDLDGQKNTWSVTPSNDRAFMLQMASEANRRWNPELATRSRGIPDNRDTAPQNFLQTSQ
jgi:hypothetical protein